MARKEAIEKIKKMTYKDDFMAFVKSLNLSRDDYRAMMEYIDELSAVQPDHIADTGKKVCVDAISRQAAIEVLSLGKEILSRVLDDVDVVGTDREKYSWGIGLIESNIEDIKDLPSTQPDWNEMIVICDCCGHAIHVQRQ